MQRPIAAVAAHLECYTAFFVELMAIRSALAFTYCKLEFQHRTIIFESDSKEAVWLINGEAQQITHDVDNIIKEIYHLKGNRNLTFVHVDRLSNEAANWLAKFAKCNGSSMFWDRD